MRLVCTTLIALCLCEVSLAQALSKPSPTIVEIEVTMFGYPLDATYIACVDSDGCPAAQRKTLWVPEPRIISKPLSEPEVAQSIDTPKVNQDLTSDRGKQLLQNKADKQPLSSPAPQKKTRRASKINCTPVQAMPRSGGSKEAAAKKANPQTIQE